MVVVANAADRQLSLNHRLAEKLSVSRAAEVAIVTVGSTDKELDLEA